MENFGEIQLKPPTTEKDKELFTEREKRTKEGIGAGYTSDIEATGLYLLRILKDGNKYSETIPINADGEINDRTFMHNANRTLLEGAKSFRIDRKGLNKLIEGVEKKFKHLKFSLDESGNDITLTVENDIRKGVFVNWINQGANQWSGPRSIDRLSPDGQYAFFSGSMTGIPVNQLELLEADFV